MEAAGRVRAEVMLIWSFWECCPDLAGERRWKARVVLPLVVRLEMLRVAGAAAVREGCRVCGDEPAVTLAVMEPLPERVPALRVMDVLLRAPLTVVMAAGAFWMRALVVTPAPEEMEKFPLLINEETEAAESWRP